MSKLYLDPKALDAAVSVGRSSGPRDLRIPKIDFTKPKPLFAPKEANDV